MKHAVIRRVPKGLRQGQTMIVFLRWLENEYATYDIFHLSDDVLNRYYEEFLEVHK